MGNAACLYFWLTTAMSPIISLYLNLLKPRHLKVEEVSHEELPQTYELKTLKLGNERLGFSRLPRPEGPLIWFHGVSLGEAMEALPMIKKCLEDRLSVNILMTTVTVSAFSVLLRSLPEGVICQFAPVDTPAAVDRFLTYWHPSVAIFMESELWPNLILATSSRRIPLALLNAKMSVVSYRRWSLEPVKGLAKEIISKFDLITPVNNMEAVRYQNLGARPHQVHFGGNLKYTSGAMDFSVVDGPVYHGLGKQMHGRQKIWLAASIHPGEEKVVVLVHQRLKVLFPDVLTVIVPRHPERGADIKHDTLEAMARRLGRSTTELGCQVSRRSLNEPLTVSTEVYIADTLGELAIFYHLVDVAFVGGSLIEGLNGHNVAEPASAGCAVITGIYVGHFQDMIAQMQTYSPLSVEQVSGEDELFDCVRKLFEDSRCRAERREAALAASNAAAAGRFHYGSSGLV
ncbi:hypothetical protein R1flu_019660 [Riccia fluitans]|uniref:lipid IVA 3-deoxy-D-manno-octulosonic acid transferase n=1 Tax=Riccia fluitans TaxID=41844 RepID=A0ABD1ZKC3_9MARC